MKKRKKNKKNILFKIFIIIIIGIILFCVLFQILKAVWPALNEYSDKFHFTSEDTPEFSSESYNELEFLTVSGSSIVSESGEPVILEGVNLGGWLLQEYWMCPVSGDPSVEKWTHMETVETLISRFGEKKAEKLLQEYQDNWITEWDIQNIASMGCNVIRVPFGYWNFMSDPYGTWLTEDMDDNPGFQTLDWVIETAGKYGIYVILDMHGCPGGQNYSDCDGDTGNYELFENSEYQDAMEKLWVTIAERYKDSSVVAAYDIMNEPESYEGSVDSDPRNLLYDRMIKAIRAVDSRHIITVEAMWQLSVLPNPAEWGWQNVMYQVHPYGVTDNEAYCQSIVSYSQEYGLPIYVGEFSDLNMLENCRKYGISFTTWTYKGTIYADGTWFMYMDYDLPTADVCNDPYWLIKEKWGECLLTQNFEKNEEISACWLE